MATAVSPGGTPPPVGIKRGVGRSNYYTTDLYGILLLELKANLARIVSASQFGAGMWLEACPDASVTYARANSGVKKAVKESRGG